MKCDIYGKIEKPVAVLVGTWDPLLQEHFLLMEKANRHCEDLGYELLIVLLDPFPSNLLLNRVLPIFDCTDTRIRLILNKINGAVCKISMIRKDVDCGAREFLDELKVYFQIAELWLHPGQSLGRCAEGSRKKIEQVCKDYNILIRDISPNDTLRKLTMEVRGCLQKGAIEDASKLIGHPPLWHKPNSNGHVQIGWQDGFYHFRPARLLDNNKIKFEGDPVKMKVFLNHEGHSVFDWPDNNINLIAITQ